MQQQEELRDINIVYQDVNLPVQVSTNTIVSEFFLHQLKNYSDRFSDEAKKKNLGNFVPLSQLKNYDVTLNSKSSDASVMKNVGTDFGSYKKDKQLRFYVIESHKKSKASEQASQKNITFDLIEGNSVSRTVSIDISGMEFKQFQSKIREVFNIDYAIKITYKDVFGNNFLNLASKKPIEILNRQRITKVAVIPVYQAGWTAEE